MRPKVAIIGAGISGLATAYYARNAAELVIFEAQTKAGGTMRSAREQGFVMEWGPNGFLTNRPQTLELVRELGCEGRLLPSSQTARKRYIFSAGRMHLLPERPAEFFGSSLLSMASRLRVLCEPFAAAAPAGRDESVSEFARRRLGTEALEKLIEPMASGVFAGDPDELSLQSCFPRIHELESRYGGLVKAMLALRAARPEMSAGPGGVLTSFDTGTQALVEILADRLAENLRLGARVENIERRGGRYWINEASFDAVVVATPAYAASRLLRGLDAQLADDLDRIPYAPIAVAALGFDANALKRPLDGFGFLVPRQEGRRILGVLWDSSVFPGRAPQGKALIRVMVGGARQPELARLPEKDLLLLIREELKACMGISDEPLLTRVFFHERGIPQYLVGHGRLLEHLAKRLSAYPGLHLNSNAYRGVSLNDCVGQSQRIAQRLLAELAGQRA